MSSADDLHERIFGFRPKKDGTAYERLAAMSFAVMGWEDVVHDSRLAGPGRRSKHQIDVSGTHPDGSVSRLIVECKDWDKTVGKGTLDALVGIRDQTKTAAAAVVTTEGFTRGARQVAADEDIALVRIRTFGADDPFNYVKSITLSLTAFIPDRRDFSFDFHPDRSLSTASDGSVNLVPESHFRTLEGVLAETFGSVVESNGAPLEEGTFNCEARFEDGRLVQTADGENIAITAVRWIEDMRGHVTSTTTEAKGEPCLVLEQLDERGESVSGRVIVDRDLYSWSFDEEGRLAKHGPLAES